MSEYTQITTEIMDLKKDIVANFWKIGYRLNKIKEEKLYLEKYHFFEEYIEQEVNFEIRSAEMYMRLAKEIEAKRVSLLSLRRWNMLLPLEAEDRENILTQIAEKEEEISDFAFKELVNTRKSKREYKQELSKIPEIPEKDWKTYWELELIANNIIETIIVLKTKLKDFELLYEKSSKMPSWFKYPRKSHLIGLRHQIIKEIANLK